MKIKLGETSLFIFLCHDSATFVVLGKPRFRRSATDHISGGNIGGLRMVCFVGLPLKRIPDFPKTYGSSKYCDNCCSASVLNKGFNNVHPSTIFKQYSFVM
ncbi:unnamed protein product [Macrosiphum euphorbiae]|uniref:Uncharacterized protein n=1 Tax=Macrosiphum euphorbiae TaxID=13131 RepID=A0AAV0WXS6_9HEMI|nr:unnamed protein product [Macrosiphum euphorbiae]